MKGWSLDIAVPVSHQETHPRRSWEPQAYFPYPDSQTSPQPGLSGWYLQVAFVRAGVCAVCAGELGLTLLLAGI